MNRIELTREKKKQLTETRAFGKPRYRVHATFSWNGEQKAAGWGWGEGPLRSYLHKLHVAEDVDRVVGHVEVVAAA